MTDAEKIEKLAKWMGWHRKGRSNWFTQYEEAANRNWNPLTNIADAWDLINRAQQIWMDTDSRWNKLDQLAENILSMTAHEVARTISGKILEVVK